MRLPEAKIKEALLHPEIVKRERATFYFARSFSPDPSLMPLVIRAVDTFGRTDAYKQLGPARDLVQTPETIDWVIRELRDERCRQYENFAYNLAMILVEADPTLLVSRESEVLQLRDTGAPLGEGGSRRLRMLEWDADTCWRRLEEFCEASKSANYINDADIPYGRNIVEELARKGGDFEARIRTILAQKIDDYSNNPMEWLEPMVIRLAGLLRLQSAVELINAKLLDDAGDLGNQECAEALTRIGTDAVIDALARSFPTASAQFRIYASGVLENIRSDRSVEVCLARLEQEKDKGVRANLAQALLGLFAFAGIEATRQLVLCGSLGFESQGLRQELLEVASFMGMTFPEYDEWLATERAEREEHFRRVAELQDDPRRLMLYLMSKLSGQPMPPELEAKPKPAPARRLDPAPASRLALPKPSPSKGKVGRNDPCRCGSGKKFKNCCLNR